MMTGRYAVRALARLAIIWIGCIGLAGCASRADRFFSQAEPAKSTTQQEKSAETTEGTVQSEESAEKEGNSALSEDAQEEPAASGADTQAADTATDTQGEPTEIYVDVSGAVANPGVYCLPENSRVFQAIEAAGGCAPEGDISCLNQASELTDGQKIYVPTAAEVEESGGRQALVSSVLQGEQASALSGGQSSAQAEENASGAQAGTSGGKVNLNTADEAALTSLPGIGSAKAAAILAYRQEHGSFSSIEEIMNVEGIKEGVYAKIKDRLSLE